jgi:hypothetical protein
MNTHPLAAQAFFPYIFVYAKACVFIFSFFMKKRKEKKEKENPMKIFQQPQNQLRAVAFLSFPFDP